MLPHQAPYPRTLRLLGARSATRLLLVAVILILTAPVGLPPAPAQAASPAPPTITAPAAILVEYPSGKILYAKNPHQRLPEASTTKTMTALLALQRVALTDVVTATADDLVGESTMGLAEGEQQTVLNLLYGLMLPSGNDAAMVLARHVGSALKEPAAAGPVGRFVALMNAQAAQMGLADTHYVNPHGFDDPNHYSSAYDLASIAWYDLHNPVFNEIVRQAFHDVPGHSLQNTDEMLTRYPGADGIKTGWTSIANNCFVGSATRNGRRLITVTLDEQHGFEWPDNTALFDYGFAQPSAATAETLTIARRAQLLWFLSADLPTPLPTPRPTATAVADATPAAQGFSLPNLLGGATGSPPQLGTAPAATGRSGGAAGPASTSWLWPLLAVPAGALLLLLTWQRRRHPGQSPFSLRLLPLAAAARSMRATPVPAPPGRAPVPPRINLLNSGDARTRAERAVAHAYRGQEGASLTEFMLVVKQDPEFEFGVLPGFYDMPAAGYLTLARAYIENNRPHYAAALLELGQETHKDDRAIARMLAELAALTL